MTIVNRDDPAVSTPCRTRRRDPRRLRRVASSATTPPGAAGLVRGRRGAMAAPPGWVGRGHRADRSGAGYVDGYRDGVADDVPHGRVAGEAGELGELIVVVVAGGLDGDPDLLVAGADAAVQGKEAVQVQVAVDRGLQAVVQGDAAGGGVVDDRA